MDTLSGNVWFSKLDGNSDFHQIKIRTEDQKKKTFVTRYDLYVRICSDGALTVQRSDHIFPGHELGVAEPHLVYYSGFPGRRLGPG